MTTSSPYLMVSMAAAVAAAGYVLRRLSLAPGWRRTAGMLLLGATYVVIWPITTFSRGTTVIVLLASSLASAALYSGLVLLRRPGPSDSPRFLLPWWAHVLLSVAALASPATLGSGGGPVDFVLAALVATGLLEPVVSRFAGTRRSDAGQER